MEKDKCFVCFEEGVNLSICCHICKPLICDNCLQEMNKLHNSCTICNNRLPLGYREVEIGEAMELSVVKKPVAFYLDTKITPKYSLYSVEINGIIINNILKTEKLSDKYYLLNSNFPFHYFEKFSILYEENIVIKSISSKSINLSFQPTMFVGLTEIIFIYDYNSLKTVFKNYKIFREDFNRVCRNNRKHYFTITDNVFYRNLEEGNYNSCCIFL